MIFLDTETTGLGSQDRLIQIAYKQGIINVNEYFKPEVPINLSAMMVNHITEDMVSDKPVFKGSDVYNDIQERLKTDILVAHNAQFDIMMLEREGISVSKYTCTKELAKRLLPDLPCHRLQYLRYYFGIKLDSAIAHTAEGDVAVLEAVYHKLREL